MQQNMAEVANETRVVVFFNFWGGQLPITCERCNVCTITDKGTSFWNIVWHSFTIHSVLTVFLHGDICFVKQSELIYDISGKRCINEILWWDNHLCCEQFSH